MLESTPTTSAELQAALALVAGAQGPLPWDPQCSTQRPPSIGPVFLMATYDHVGRIVTLYFDQNLNSDSQAPSNFVVHEPTAVAGVTILPAVSAGTSGDNTCVLSLLGSVPGTGDAFLTYVNNAAPFITDVTGLIQADPFTVKLEYA